MFTIFFHTFVFFFFGSLYFFRESYLCELVVSFFPYITGILLFFLLYWIINLGKKFYLKKNSIKTKVAPLFLICFGILSGLYLYELNHFYHQDYINKEPLENPIKVLFSNIYKDNYNFEEIQKKLLDENPDVVMFVEFSDEHEQGLKEFVKQYYPYWDKTNWSKIYGGSIVMSKYPVKNLQPQLKQDGSWKYGYFSIEKDNVLYYFYLIHTSSPVSYFDFNRRNQQLKYLRQSFFEVDDISRPLTSKIIMVGDFNISPRSVYYKDFSNKISGRMINVTRTFPMLFTRSLTEMVKVHRNFDYLSSTTRNIIGSFPFIWSHIDQLFVSPSVKLGSLSKIHFKGSDHDGFVFEIE